MVASATRTTSTFQIRRMVERCRAMCAVSYSVRWQDAPSTRDDSGRRLTTVVSALTLVCHVLASSLSAWRLSSFGGRVRRACGRDCHHRYSRIGAAPRNAVRPGRGPVWHIVIYSGRAVRTRGSFLAKRSAWRRLPGRTEALRVSHRGKVLASAVSRRASAAPRHAALALLSGYPKSRIHYPRRRSYA